jgi:hypothetical protein
MVLYEPASVTASVAVNSIAANSIAANSIAANSTTAKTSASVCAVCAAKAAGTRVPKRKCTCESGQTHGRGACCLTHDRLREREDRDENGILLGHEVDYEQLSHDEIDQAGEFELQLTAAVESGDLDALRRLSRLDSQDAGWIWALVWRTASSKACEHGQLHMLDYLIDQCGASLNDLYPHYDWLDPDHAKKHNLEPVPNPAPLLFIAVSHGQAGVARLLLGRGIDVNAPAYDGVTPFSEACAMGHLELAQLLRNHGADMMKADQDGSAPIHSAVLEGHLDIVEFLVASGVDADARGTVFVDTDWEKQLKDVTPLMIARYMRHKELVHFLQSRGETAAPAAAPKRPRSEIPMQERAERAGVAYRLAPIPPSIRHVIQTGSTEQKQAARKQLQKLQTANQQIIARAEQKQLKQTKLV